METIQLTEAAIRAMVREEIFKVLAEEEKRRRERESRRQAHRDYKARELRERMDDLEAKQARSR